MLPQVLDRQLRDDGGLTHVQYQILARLSAAPDRQLRMGELARGVAISLSRLSHAISTLERNGLVTRIPSDDDGRGHISFLTEQGQHLLELAAPGHVATVRRAVFDALTEQDLAALADIGQRILKQLEA